MHLLWGQRQDGVHRDPLVQSGGYEHAGQEWLLTVLPVQGRPADCVGCPVSLRAHAARLEVAPVAER